MIYLDNAATTLIRPPKVIKAANKAILNAAGYGRSGHKAAVYAGEIVYTCRERVKRLFNIKSPEQVIFTLNATHALNQAIYSLAPKAKKIAITGYEHNSVVRPLYARNIDYYIIESELFNEKSMLDGVKKALDNGCDLFIINHISNVFGQIAPIEQIDKMLYDANASMIIDASQSAGKRKIDLSSLKSVKALCTAGHKGLLGLTGTGILVVCTDEILNPLMQGGTGSLSNDLNQPYMLPDRLESGTPNIVGIASLSEGINHILSLDYEESLKHEQDLLKKTVKELAQISDIEIFSKNKNQAGVLSFRHKKIPCEKIAESLAENDICVRAGLHCAPLAHKSAGTLETGTVRISFGFNTKMSDINQFTLKLKKILKNNDKI